MCNERQQYPFPLQDIELWKEAGRSITPKVIDTIDMLLEQLAAHTLQTAQHSERVARYVETLAIAANLPQLAVLGLTQAARLHDIGKLCVDNKLVDSLVTLTGEDAVEYEFHPIYGKHIIQGHSDLPPIFKKLAADMAIDHHERADGKGYPRNLALDEIKLAGLLLSPADAIDARANRGRNQAALGLQATLDEMIQPANPVVPGKFQPEWFGFCVSTLRQHAPAFS